jgi:hypothetical protein
MINAVFRRRFAPPKCLAPIANPSSKGMLKRGSSFAPSSVRDRSWIVRALSRTSRFSLSNLMLAASSSSSAQRTL